MKIIHALERVTTYSGNKPNISPKCGYRAPYFQASNVKSWMNEILNFYTACVAKQLSQALHPALDTLAGEAGMGFW